MSLATSAIRHGFLTPPHPPLHQVGLCAQVPSRTQAKSFRKTVIHIHEKLLSSYLAVKSSKCLLGKMKSNLLTL